MSKKEHYHNKDFIMNCDMPSELFTVRGIKREYRALAKIWHPDVSPIKEALFIMSKINALYNEGQSLIDQNKFYEKERLIYRGRNRQAFSAGKVDEVVEVSPVKRSKRKRIIELKSTEGKCVRFKYLKRVMIELGFMYVSEQHILLEITKLKKKIFLDAIAMLKHRCDGYFKFVLP